MIALIWVASLQAAAVQDYAVVPPAHAQNDSVAVLEEVTVVGNRADVRVEIDKRIYRVTDAPQVETATTLEILAQSPSVTVTPSGRVQLLGNADVTVLIDGKPPVSTDAALKTLPANQIDRVEVMTNPSAQYGAQGTAGILNIITAKRTAPGWSGTVSLSGNTLGAGQIAFSPALSRETWSFQGAISLTRQRGETSGDTVRLTDTSDGALAQDLRYSEFMENTEDRARLSSRYVYRASPRDTMSVSAEVMSRQNVRSSTTDVAGSQAYVERSHAPDQSTGGNFSADFERTGPRDGQSLKLATSVSYLDWTLENDATVDYDSGSVLDSRYRTSTEIKNETDTLTLDYVRPAGSAITFYTGASWERSVEDTVQSLNVLQGDGPGSDANNAIQGERDLSAIYATAQFPWREWTVKPGLRLEYNDFEVRAADVSVRNQDAAVFPSLHLRRQLGDKVALNVSYSRRINRPDAQRLSPYITFSSNTSAQSGNPELGAETTNSYEVRFEYTKNSFKFDATLYDRETSNGWSQASSLISDSVVLTTYVNTGERSERGAEWSIRGPLGTGWKYQATINTFYSNQATYGTTITAMQSAFSYTVNSQIDYRTHPSNGSQSDEFQLSLRHFGPQVFYQRKLSRFTQVDLTWRHIIKNGISLVTSVNDVFNSTKNTTTTDLYNIQQTSNSRGSGTTLRAALVYSFK